MSIMTTLLTPCFLICVLSISNLYCLHQTVTGPTHVHHDGSKSTIDLVLMSEPSFSMLNRCETIPPLANSDHLGISLDLSIKPIKTEKTQGRLIWRYAYADWTKACELTDNYNWDSILSEDIETSWKLWHHQFLKIMSESIPNRVIRTRKNLPWLDKSIVNLMKKRNLLFKRAKRTGDYCQYTRTQPHSCSTATGQKEVSLLTLRNP